MVLKRRRNSECGAGLAEAVIATPLFVILVIAALQLLVMAWQALSIQFIATVIMREITQRHCGKADTYVCSNTEILNYAKQQLQVLAASYRLGPTPTNPAVCISGNGTLPSPCTPTTTTSVPNPGVIAAVVVQYDHSLLGGANFNVMGFSTGLGGPVVMRGVAVGFMERKRG
jgi:hypothetical protein